MAEAFHAHPAQVSDDISQRLTLLKEADARLKLQWNFPDKDLEPLEKRIEKSEDSLGKERVKKYAPHCKGSDTSGCVALGYFQMSSNQVADGFKSLAQACQARNTLGCELAEFYRRAGAH
jgi:hypothetical protein